MLPLRMIHNPIAGVAVPALSRLQDDPARLRSYFYKAVGLVMALSMPLVAWLAAVSDSLILTVLGEQWRESIEIFRIRTIPAFIATTNVATGWVFVSLGLVRRQLFTGIANTIVGVIAIAIGLSWGIEGVAWALVVSALVRRIPTLVCCYWGTPFTLRALGQVMWRPTLAAGLAGAVTFWAHAGFAPDLCPPLALAASLPIFSLAYLVGLLGLPGGRELVSEALGHLHALRAPPAAVLG
jgi:O-antigen/teichoic acid export membrane protein